MRNKKLATAHRYSADSVTVPPCHFHSAENGQANTFEQPKSGSEAQATLNEPDFVTVYGVPVNSTNLRKAEHI